MEKDRLKFYLNRASETRLHDEMDEEAWQAVPEGEAMLMNAHNRVWLEHTLFDNDKKLYMKYMLDIFDERPAPLTFERNQIFDGNSLRQEVFDAAYTHIRGESSPGYPFHAEYAMNDEVPKDLLKMHVESLLLRWEHSTEESTADKAFYNGWLYFAHIFVKGEPTKEDKVARLIFGVSLVMNMIGRILMGDYLLDVSKTWGSACHKVGMDMYTEKGVEKLDNFFSKVFDSAEKHDMRVVSDDIQGWEFQGRKWMHDIWHHCYLHRAKATSYHRKIQLMYARMEASRYVMFSDGVVFKLPYYITLSGKPTTHLQNSDERAALAKLDCGEIFKARRQGVLCATNGDDCVAPMVEELIVDEDNDMISHNLGFVHTDKVVQTRDRVNFSSQIFLRGEDGKMKRIPDGMAKTFYDACENSELESRLGKELHFKDHPALEDYKGLLECVDIVERRKVIDSSHE